MVNKRFPLFCYTILCMACITSAFYHRRIRHLVPVKDSALISLAAY